MTSARRHRTVPDPRPSVDPSTSAELRRVVLLLETAAVLEARARRAGDATRAAVLLRRATQRRREAARLREELAARGAALTAHQVRRTSGPSNRREPFRPGSPVDRWGDARVTSPRRTEDGVAES